MSELTITDQRLKPIAEKVLAGERLSFDDGITALPLAGFAGGRMAGESRAREKARQRDVLQRQPAHQSDEHLRGALQAVRVWPRSQRSRRLQLFAGRDLCARGTRRSRRRAGISHRRRTASGFAVRIFSGDDSRAEATLPGRASEGVHDGRGGLLRAHREAIHQRNADEVERSGRGFAARRRSGDFSSAGAPDYLRSQSQRADVAEHCAAGA